MKRRTSLRSSKLLIANWKLNPETSWAAIRLAKAVDKKGVVICPPFIFLTEIKKVLKRAALGAQDVFWEEKGAYTGEVSAAALRDLGVKYVIIGHSERRRWLRETDEMINKKVRAALGAGLKAILCVGEPLSVRRQGLATAKKFVKNQLKKDLKSISMSHVADRLSLIIAYEPVWAIGTGRADKPEETVEMAKFIKSQLPATGYRLPVLYGGSVNSLNARNFLQYKDINGALVGGASLNAKEFGKIIAQCAKQ